jgi:hypothetical protein
MIDVNDLTEVVRPIYPAIRAILAWPASGRLPARQHACDPVRRGRARESWPRGAGGAPTSSDPYTGPYNPKSVNSAIMLPACPSPHALQRSHVSNGNRWHPSTDRCDATGRPRLRLDRLPPPAHRDEIGEIGHISRVEADRLPTASRPTGGGAIAAKSRCSPSATLLPAPSSAGFALPRLISLNARQQFFFQQSPLLSEPLNLDFETIEELDDLAVLVTKRVEACVRRH